MSRVMRLIIYETNDLDRMARQLGKSLSNGEYNYGNMKITALTINSETVTDAFIKSLKDESGLIDNNN